MGWQSAVILGIVQGITELLPVSSSGHLVLVEKLLGLNLTDVSFEISLHVATAVAICFFLRGELASIFRGLLPGSAAGDLETRRRGRGLLRALVVGTIPAVVLGFVAYDAIERVFHCVGLTVAMLPVTGLFLISTRWARDKGLAVSPLLALVIGVAQAVAIIPGISRSGATVGTALLLGVKREDAVKFSFLLSLPAILGGAVLKLAKAAGESAPAVSAIAAPQAAVPVASPALRAGVGAPMLILGSVVAFLFALLGARVLLGVVRRGKLEYFGYYCILVGLAYLIFTWC